MKKMSDYGLFIVICLVWKWCYFLLVVENLIVILYFIYWVFGLKKMLFFVSNGKFNCN